MIRALDIFCGAGGGSWGARAAGVEIVGALDMCPIATATYEANFLGTRVVTSRLEEVSPLRLKRQLGGVDLLISSPECTNHTCAKGSAPRSEESRATAMQVVEFARAFRPRWVILENVIHMRPWSRFEELKNLLRQLGYRLAEQVLNAAEYGVPQSRKRLFLVGDRCREPVLASPAKEKVQSNAASVLDPVGTWRTGPLRSDRRASDTLARAERGIAALGRNTPFLLVYYGTDGGGGWQILNRSLRTVTTIDRFGLVEPTPAGHTLRMLQVSELRRAMGMEDAFVLPIGTRRDRIRLLGNGICPPVMEAVVAALTSEAHVPQPRLRFRDVDHDLVQHRVP